MKYNLLGTLDELGIEYRYVDHEPVVDYESARAVDEKYNLVGVESKNLFLKGKSGKFYVMVSVEGSRFDRRLMKELTGEKLSISTPEDLVSATGYAVGCAASFGYDQEITLLIDKSVFTYDTIICSAGIPTGSYVMKCEDLKKIYDQVNNQIIYFTFPAIED